MSTGAQACVEQGTHYVDITAESHFVRNMIDEFHVAARAARVRIVHNCGFDSVPSDVVTLLAAHHMRAAHGKALGDVTAFVGGGAAPARDGSAALAAGPRLHACILIGSA